MKSGYDTYTLLMKLMAQGLKVWEENGKIKYRYKAGKADNTCLQELKDNKESILSWLYQTGKEKVAMTPLQQAYLLGEEKECELGNINAHYYIEFEAPDIRVSQLELAINKVIQANDALRMVVRPDGSLYFFETMPFYKVHTSNGINSTNMREKWQHYQYEPGSWPMFNFAVTHIENGADILHVSFDCMILDAWSARQMISQIFNLYADKQTAFSRYSFEQYLQDIKAYPQQEQRDKEAEAYWQAQAKEIPPAPCLKTLCNYADVEKPDFIRMEYAFSAQDTQRLYLLSKKYHVTAAAVICTIFLKVLSCYSANQDVSINLTLYNRIPVNEEIGKTLGEFTNVGLASYIHKEEAVFQEEVKSIQRQFLKLLQYRTYDGTRIFPMLPFYRPKAAVMPVVYTSMLSGELKSEYGDNGFREVYSLSQTPQVAIDHHVRDDLGYLKISWDYVEQLFDIKHLEHIFSVYVEMIKSVLQEKRWDSNRIWGTEGKLNEESNNSK